MTDIPLKDLPRLVWELKIRDDIFCKSLIHDKLWIHFSNNVAYLLDTDQPSSETIFVISMQDIEISKLDRSTKMLYLVKPLTYANVTFDKLDVSYLTVFKQHMMTQNQLITIFFEWNELSIIDTGIQELDAWKTLTKS